MTLVAADWTLSNCGPGGPHNPTNCTVDFRARVEAAAAAGYRGVGLIQAHLDMAKVRYGYSGIAAILADNAIEHLELEWVQDWFGPRDVIEAAEPKIDALLEAAARLKADHVKAIGGFDGSVWPIEDMAERFAALSRRGREAGTRIALELLPFSNIRDVPTALAVLGEGSEFGAGLAFDSWHVFRGGIPLDAIRGLCSSQIAHVELADAKRQVRGSLIEDTTRRRELCGEGELDLASFLRAVRMSGFAGPIGVEIISDAQRARSLSERARRSFETAAAVVGAA